MAGATADATPRAVTPTVQDEEDIGANSDQIGDDHRFCRCLRFLDTDAGAVEAIERGHAGCLSRLLGDFGLSPNRRHPSTGEPLLFLASQRGYVECVRALLSAGASAAMRSDDGSTAMLAACHAPDSVRAEILDTLAESGGEIHTENDDGVSAWSLVVAQLARTRAASRRSTHES